MSYINGKSLVLSETKSKPKKPKVTHKPRNVPEPRYFVNGRMMTAAQKVTYYLTGE